MCKDSAAALSLNRLFRFIQVLLKVGHEGRATSPDGRRIALMRLMLPMDIAIGVPDMDLAELGQQIDAGAIGGPEVRALCLSVPNVA